MPQLIIFLSKLCKSDDFAKGLLYCDVPRYYTWVVSHKKFKRRVQGTSVDDHPGVRKSDVLGRVYTVHPNQFQCFCLRLLLHEVQGPTCFEDLRTVDGVVYDTFQEATNKRGHLEDDAHWNDTLRRGRICPVIRTSRTLFAVMLRSYPDVDITYSVGCHHYTTRPNLKTTFLSLTVTISQHTG